MKPIPPEILAMYPSHPDAPIPERPWWTGDVHSVRRIVGGAERVILARDGGAMRIIEDIDAKHPIPHPGFRVGQVWAWVWVTPKTTESVDVFRFLGLDGVGAIQITQVMPGGSIRLELGADAWLLADPCCPWLAPWGPT